MAVTQKGFGSRRGFWISLLIPLYFGLVSAGYRLSHASIVQDDQRLHLVWLQQWLDPQLFQNDLIAQYYQSIQPIGFRAFYWMAAQLSIEPMTLAAMLPLILALMSSIFLYRVTFRLLPHPLAPLLTVLIFNQNIWCKDDLVSASPRSFAYLLLILFLDSVIQLKEGLGRTDSNSANRHSLANRLPGLNEDSSVFQSPPKLGNLGGSPAFWCLSVLILQGLFYPQIMLVSLGVLWLQLLPWRHGRVSLSRDRSRYLLAVVGLVLTGIILLFFSGNASTFGEIFSAAQMRSMPEFQPGGRRAYFGVNPLQFWFGGASGLRLPLFPPILWTAIGLPLVLNRKGRIASALQPEIKILAQMMIASVGLFGLAHLTFPLLYLPSRYTFYSSRVVMSIAAGITLTFLIDRCWKWVSRLRQAGLLHPHDRIMIAFVVLFAIVAVIVPAIPPLFLSNQGWIIAEETNLYSFLANQPKTSMIASLSPITDNIPAFSRRSVLFSPELALPYHSGFYQAMQQRINDIVQAQYSSDASNVKRTIEKYKINLWIIASTSFDSDYLLKQPWFMNRSMRSNVLQAVAQFQPGKPPILQTLSQQCTIFSENSDTVIDAQCVVRLLSATERDVGIHNP